MRPWLLQLLKQLESGESAGKSAEPEEVLIRLLRLVKYEKRLVDQRSVVAEGEEI